MSHKRSISKPKEQEKSNSVKEGGRCEILLRFVAGDKQGLNHGKIGKTTVPSVSVQRQVCVYTSGSGKHTNAMNNESSTSSVKMAISE